MASHPSYSDLSEQPCPPALLDPQEQMEKPTLVTKGGVGYGVDETEKVLAPRCFFFFPLGAVGFVGLFEWNTS